MATHLRFSVIIVNYNGGDYLKGAIDSLSQQTVRDFEVFVVDNASRDGSMDFLFETAPHFPIELMPQTENLGFAAANNLAAQKARGDWLVLLNPDAVAAPDWLNRLAAAAHRYPGVKSFASAQYDLHNPELLDGAGDAYLGIGFAWRGGFGHPAENLPAEGECFSPCGAGAMIDRKRFLQLGGFDERFFCYCEDVDLGYRMRLAGERCVFVPDAIIHHAGSAITGRASAFAVTHGTRNRLWTYIKNTPLRLLIVTAPFHIALTCFFLIRGLMTGRHATTWEGLWQGITGMGPFLSERRQLRTERQVHLWDLIRAMCWNPLMLSQRKAHIRPVRQTQKQLDTSS